MNRNTLRFLPLTLFFACVAWTQDYRARVQGIITDPANAAVAQASVSLMNANTRTVATRVTDQFGRYLFDFVEPGTYTFTAESPGFGKFIQENVQVFCALRRPQRHSLEGRLAAARAATSASSAT